MVSDNSPLRLGILVNDPCVPAWVSHITQELDKSNSVDVVAVICLQETKRIKPRSMIAKSPRHYLFHLYSNFEDKRFHLAYDALLTKDIRAVIHGVNVISLSHRNTEKGETETLDIEQIRRMDLDVLLNLSSQNIIGQLPTAAQAGVWVLKHGDTTAFRGGPPGLWEVFENNPVTAVELKLMTGNSSKPIVIDRVYSHTSTQKSVKINLNNILWRGTTLVSRSLDRLYALGCDAFLSSVESANRYPAHYAKRQYCLPGNTEVAHFLGKKLLTSIRARLKGLFFRPQWQLLYTYEDDLCTPLFKFEQISAPKDRFWADPFVVQENGTYYLFFEDYVYSEDKAHISVISLDRSGNVSNPITILERPYHLSYPFVFVWDNEYYMIPEAKGSGSIEVYKCERFPDKWKSHSHLMKDIEAVDITLLPYNNRWWLFTSVRANRYVSVNDDLSIFYADNPLSTHWTPHPRNPIVSDVRRARPAGKIFQYNDKLFRPSQDCSITYGYGLRMNEILTLNENDYCEKEISFIEPKWKPGLIGVHTFARESGLTVVDALLWRARLW